MAASNTKKRGIFISIEGADGTGKTTQIRRIADLLEERGQAVVTTREPGGATGAEEIRRLLVDGDPNRWSADAELLLFTAARCDHVEKTISPALNEGKVVLCDRFFDSTRVYQSVARGADRMKVDHIHSLFIQIVPDLTIVLDMDYAASYRRTVTRNISVAKKGGIESSALQVFVKHARANTEISLDDVESRFESFGIEFQEKIREGFKHIVATEPKRCALINADAPEDKVAADVLAAILERLPVLNGPQTL